LPLMIKPILSNLRRDDDLKIADLAYLTGQLEGISTGAAEFRTVPASPDPSNLGILRMDPSAERIFAAIRAGTQLGSIGTEVYTLSEANVPVLVVDHSSGGKSTEVESTLSQAGFDIAPGVITYDEYGATIEGSWIAYAPGKEAQAQVVKKYFPTLELKQVKGLPDEVAVFVTSKYEPAPIGDGSTADTTCSAAA